MQPSSTVHVLLKSLRQNGFISGEMCQVLSDALKTADHPPTLLSAQYRPPTFPSLVQTAQALQRSKWAQDALSEKALPNEESAWGLDQIEALRRRYALHERLIPSVALYVPTASKPRKKMLETLLAEWRPIFIAMTKLRPIIVTPSQVNSLIRAACKELEKPYKEYHVKSAEFTTVDNSAYKTAFDGARTIYQAQNKLITEASTAGRIHKEEARERLRSIANALHWYALTPRLDYFLFQGTDRDGEHCYYLYDPSRKIINRNYEYRYHQTLDSVPYTSSAGRSFSSKPNC